MDVSRLKYGPLFPSRGASLGSAVGARRSGTDIAGTILRECLWRLKTILYRLRPISRVVRARMVAEAGSRDRPQCLVARTCIDTLSRTADVIAAISTGAYGSGQTGASQTIMLP